MSAVEAPSFLLNLGGKKAPQALVHDQEDVYWSHGGLLSRAESAKESLERMLAIIRLLLTFFTDILKPSNDPNDAPFHFLGNHYLSHRNLGDALNGTLKRVLVQEICSLDAEERPRARAYPGVLHSTVHIKIDPIAYAQGKLLSKHASVKVELGGRGVVDFPRHMEEYVFNLPDLLFQSPLSEECPVSLSGDIALKCLATGLSAQLSLYPDGGCKGSVSQLAGSGTETVCKMTGSWNDRVVAETVGQDMEGALFEAGSKPGIQKHLNLSQLPAMRIPRLWTALHDALVYCKTRGSSNKAAERLAQDLRSLNSLVTEAFIRAVSFDADDSCSDCDDEEKIDEKDNCKLPPSIIAQHKAGNHMGYNIELKLLGLEHYDIEASKTSVPNTAAEDLVKKREQDALKK